MAKKQITPWAALDKLVAYEAEPTGPGWFTAQDFAQRYSVSVSVAHEKLRVMHQNGKVKRWYGRRATGGRPICKFKAT